MVGVKFACSIELSQTEYSVFKELIERLKDLSDYGNDRPLNYLTKEEQDFVDKLYGEMFLEEV